MTALFARIEDAEGYSWQICSIRTRAIQVTSRYLYIYRTDFVWPRMPWKGRRRVQTVEPGHVASGGKRTRVADREARGKDAGDGSESS